MAISKPEVLHDKHLLEQFDCGNPSLNEWLLRHAKQAQSSGSAKTFVVSDDNIVIGYFSLTVGQVETYETPAYFGLSGHLFRFHPARRFGVIRPA